MTCLWRGTSDGRVDEIVCSPCVFVFECLVGLTKLEQISTAVTLMTDNFDPGLTDSLESFRRIALGVPVWMDLPRQPSVRFSDQLGRGCLLYLEDRVVIFCGWTWSHI